VNSFVEDCYYSHVPEGKKDATMNYESSATLRLSDEHYEQLAMIAKKKDTSISKLLRKITIDFLSQSCDHDGLIAVCENCGL